MTPIQHSIAKVRRRIATDKALHALGWALMVVLCLATLIVVADKRLLLGVPMWFYGVLAGAGVVVALVIGLRNLPDDAQAAVLLDDKLGLKDKLATSMYTAGLAEQNELTAQVAREADEAARQAAARVNQAAPIRVSAVWNVTPIAMAVLAVVWFFVPQAPAQTPEEIALAQAREREQAIADQVSDVIINTVDPTSATREPDDEGEQDKPMSDSAEDRLVSISNDIRNDPSGAAERIAQAESLISSAESRLGEQREIIEATYNPLRNDASALDPGTQGPANDFAQSMNRGDFQGAADALNDLQDKLNESEFTDEDRQALQDQLNNLSDQLERQAEQSREREQQARDQARQALQDRLQQEGVSPEQARDLAEQLTQGSDPSDQEQNGEQQQADGGEQQQGENGEQQQADGGDQQQGENGEQQQADGGQQQQQGENGEQQQQSDSGEQQQQASRQERIQEALEQQGMSEQQAQQQAERIAQELERQEQQANGQQQSSQMQQQLSDGLQQMAAQCDKPDGKPGEEGQGGEDGQQGAASQPGQDGQPGENAAQQAMSQLADMQRQLDDVQQEQAQMQDAMNRLSQMRDQGFDAVPGVGEGGGRNSPYDGPRGPRGSGFESYEARDDVRDAEGRVIAAWSENGEGQGGEAQVAFNESRAQAQQDAERAVTEEYVPRTYHRTITSYFDRIPEDPNAGRAPAAPR